MSSFDEGFEAIRALLAGQHPDPKTRRQLYELLTEARRADASRYDQECVPHLEPFSSWWQVPLQAAKDDFGAKAYFELLPGEPAWSVLVGRGAWSPDYLLQNLDHAGRLAGICMERWSWSDTSSFSGQRVTVSSSHICSFVEDLDSLPALRQLSITLDRTARRPDGVEYDIAFGNYEIERLCESPILDQIRVFGLSNGLEGKAMKRLARWLYWPELEELDLSHNELSDADMGLLFPDEMAALRCLTLRGNERLGEFRHEGRFPALEYLDLRSCGVSKNEAQRLMSSDQLPKLRTVLT